MKCPSCHTNLPDFRPFDKKVCPNCNAAVPQARSQKKQAAAGTYIALILYGFASFMSLLFVILAISETLYYYNNQHTFVQTEAVISEIFEETDSEGDVDYDVYISFTFNGTEYTDVRYPHHDRSMYEGQHLTVAVDPAEPDDLPEAPIAPLIVFAVASVICLLLLWNKGIKPLRSAKENALL